MSRKWTTYQQRDKHLLDADAITEEFRSNQSSVTTLDRTQLPAGCATADRIKDGALHRIWTTEITSGTHPGEINSPYRDGSTTAWQFEAPTYQVYGGSWHTLSTQTLTGFKGGNLYIEWQGSCYVNGLCHQTFNNAYPPNPKHFNLRIVVAGINVGDFWGPAIGCQSYRVFGTAQLPPGDHTVLLQWRGTASGPDDIVTNNAGQHVMQFHSWGNKSLAIGRFR